MVVYVIKDFIYNKERTLPRKGTIIEVTKYDDYKDLIVKSGLVKYKVAVSDNYQVGDIIEFSGDVSSYKVHYPYQFDYVEYLHYKNIKQRITNANIKRVGHRFTIHTLSYLVNEYIDEKFNNESCVFLKTFITGTSVTLDKENISKIGISHLFVVSGLHVSMIMLILKKILKLFHLKDNVVDFVLIVVIGLYVACTNFMISVIRVYLTFLIKKVLHLTSLDNLSINIILVCLINPYNLFNLSFILSYSIAFFMNLYEDLFTLKSKFLSKIVNMYVLTLLIQLFTLPITVSINPDFNFLSIIVNPVFIFFVSYFYLPLSFIVFFIPPLNIIYAYITYIFQYLVDFLANIDVLTISLGNTNIIFKLIYLVVFYLFLNFLYRKKYYMIFILPLFLSLWYGKGIFNLCDKIYFFDLENGEATLYVERCNKYVVLIDSGDKTDDYAFTKLLKNLGIRRINYLIISHSDDDHIGGAFDLVKRIRTDCLIVGEYEKNAKTGAVAKYTKKTLYINTKSSISNKHFSLDLISPKKDYGNINDNSLAFIFKTKWVSVLFMGDTSTKVENDLLNEPIKVDFYKIAHHGSKTSTSVSFIKHVRYKYAVCMSGYNNRFDFPHDEVVKRFDKNKLLLTKDKTTIIVSRHLNKYKLKECKKSTFMI